eukprot:474071-Hanusia_phi.AAC.1
MGHDQPAAAGPAEDHGHRGAHRVPRAGPAAGTHHARTIPCCCRSFQSLRIKLPAPDLLIKKGSLTSL